MAFQNITNLSLGNILQIYYSDGIRNQISRDYQDWEYIKREKISDPKGRQIDFYFQTSLGPSAIQRRNPGVVSTFPTAQRVSTSEHTAVVKEIQATIELDYNLWKRAEMSSDVRYAEPLKIEMESKLDALKRQLSLELHLDGTGVLGQLSAGAMTASGSNIVFQLDTSKRGHVGAFQYDEILTLALADGNASVAESDTGVVPAHYIVVDRDFDNNTVTLKPVDSNLNPVAVGALLQNVNDEAFYKYGQPTKPILGSIVDYGSASEAIPGLESLTANDGRKVHGITMSGATGGTRVQAISGADTSFDSADFEKILNKLKINVGSGAYSYKQALLAPKRYSELINARDDDRRFNASENLKNGAKAFSYMHRNDEVELTSSEFAKDTRVYIMPEAKNGQGKVIEYHGTDFMPVKAPNGSEFHLKAASGIGGGFENTIVSYMDSYGTLICKHPAAVGVIEI